MKQHSKVANPGIIVAMVLMASLSLPSFGFDVETNAPMPAVPPPVLTVVLDAGHGGKDPGNLGTGRYASSEKDVTLDVTMKLGAYIEENLPEVKVLYTRTDDSYPTLKERVKLANDAHADLFISIHCDAFESSGARGSSTYVMGMHKSEESLRVAMRENAAMLKEEGYESNYNGFDPNDPDTYIALSLRQNVNLDASLTLGAAIQKQFSERVGRKDRGVKQAGFYVISYTTMPSTLIELGFLTNPEEEDFLQSTQGRDYMASAIYRAFRDTYVEARLQEVEDQTPESPSTEQQDQHVDSSASTKEKDAQLVSEEHNIWFAVQILTTESALSPDSPELRGHSEARAYIRSGLHKYMVGTFTHPDQAHEAKSKLRLEGFQGAFVVAFDHEEQISMSQARELMNRTTK